MFKKIKDIVEEYFGSYSQPRMKDVDLFKNPSRVELIKYLKSHEDRYENSARFMIDDDSEDLYYWDSGILHEEMSDVSGIPLGKIKGVFVLSNGILYATFEANTLYSFDHKFDIDNYYDNPDEYIDLISEVDFEFESNKNIKSLGKIEIHWESQ